MIAAKGYAAPQANEKLAPWAFERREVGAHDVQIEILYCGVCHSATPVSPMSNFRKKVCPPCNLFPVN